MKIVDTLFGFVEGLRIKQHQKTLARTAGFYDASAFETLYRQDWGARKVVEIPADDMIRRWRLWKAEAPQIEAIEAVETTLAIKDHVRRALIWKRLYGGAAIVIADAGDLARPLNVERVRQGETIRLLTFSRARVASTSPIVTDIQSEFFGMPEMFLIGTRQVHASRVIIFRGEPTVDDCTVDLTQYSLTDSFWGASVLASMSYALANAQRSQTAFAMLIEEAKIDIVSIKNLGAMLEDATSRELLTKRWSLFSELKQVGGIGILNADEETYDQKQVTFTDAADIIGTYLQIIAAAADIPITRMLGRSPAGMNATGESDIRNYYDAIQAKQENTLTPALRRLDEIIIRLALGNRPADIWYDWASLWNVSDAEKASIAKTKAEVTAIYNQAGIFTRETLAKVAGNQLIEDGLYPGLEDALEEEQAALESGVLPEEEGEPDPDEDDEELFRQAAE